VEEEKNQKKNTEDNHLKVNMKLEVEEVGVGVGEREGESGNHRALLDYIAFLSSPVNQELQSSIGTRQLDAQDVTHTHTQQTCVAWTMFDLFPGSTERFSVMSRHCGTSSRR